MWQSGGRKSAGCGTRRVLTKTSGDWAIAGSMAEAVRPPRRAKARGSRTKTKVRGTRASHSPQALAVARCLGYLSRPLQPALPVPWAPLLFCPTFPYVIPPPIDTRPIPLFPVYVFLPDFVRSLVFLFPPVISLRRLVFCCVLDFPHLGLDSCWKANFVFPGSALTDFLLFNLWTFWVSLRLKRRGTAPPRMYLPVELYGGRQKVDCSDMAFQFKNSRWQWRCCCLFLIILTVYDGAWMTRSELREGLTQQGRVWIFGFPGLY